MKQPWFAVRRDVTGLRGAALTIASFLLPLAIWSAVSYVPFVWHPVIRVTNPGGSAFLEEGMTLDRDAFANENASLAAAGKPAAAGVRANPVFLPAPHEVARAFYTAFQTPPRRAGEPWLHQSLAHSVRIIAQGFALASLVGVPLGILCGTFAFFSKLFEPFVDFVRYMPPPVFGALAVAVAVLGIDDGPKFAIIFIGTVFQMIRVVANTTHLVDPALLEAAQTLGTTRKRLVTRVILPGILPNLYNDLRILLGCAWTLLTIAELIGATTGITYFVNQQGKYRHYENVFAGIAMIGLLGLVVDKFLSVVGTRLFPWQPRPATGFFGKVWTALSTIPGRRTVARESDAVPGAVAQPGDPLTDFATHSHAAKRADSSVGSSPDLLDPQPLRSRDAATA
jgi:NitT/TauT family transport system permease protein